MNKHSRSMPITRCGQEEGHALRAGVAAALLAGMLGSVHAADAQPCDIDILFDREVTLDSGEFPSGVVSGDLNGDGVADLVTAQGRAGDSLDTIRVHLSNGDRTFADPMAFGVGDRPISPLIDDFNQDGVNDLAVLNSSSRAPDDISVLLGNGDGTFQPEIRLATSDSTSGWLVSADFNSDGIPDLAQTNFEFGQPATDRVIVHLGNGDGTFGAGQGVLNVNPSADDSPRSLGTADLDGDGHADLFYTELIGGDVGGTHDIIEGRVAVLFNNGDATFRPPQIHLAGTGAQAADAADMNGDGIMDLVVVAGSGFNFNLDPGVSVLLGDGDGRFDPQLFFDAGEKTDPNFIRLRDLDADGDPDVVISLEGAPSGVHGVAVLLNNGDGTLQDEQRFMVGTNERSLTIADLDDDGHPDVARPRGVGFGTGDGSLITQRRFGVGNDPIAVTVADFDDDGISDVLVLNRPDLFGVDPEDFSLLFGLGNERFRSQVPIVIDGRPWGMATGDLNGDGLPDLAISASNTPDPIQILRNNGNGQFSVIESFRNAPTTLSMVMADFDGDGDMDIAAPDEFDGSVLLLLNNGTGSSFTTIGVPAGDEPEFLAASDLDGDGDIDLVATASDGSELSVLLNTGAGFFAPPQRFDIGPAHSSTFAPVAADFNEDGVPDIAVTGEVLDAYSVLLGNGDGSFGPAATSPLPYPYARKLAAGDLNGDGHADLAITTGAAAIGAFPGAGTFIVAGNGDGTFQQPDELASSAFIPDAPAVADVDGDGRDDLLVTGISNSDVAIMINRCPTSTPCPADLTGDGIADANDFFEYLNLFASGDAAADLTGGPDGDPDGVIDANDFFEYLNLFAAGCP